MSPLRYLGAPALTLVIVAIVAWRLGAWTIARVRSLSPSERAVVALAVGLAEIGYATFALGLCHLLRRWLLLAIAGGLVAATVPAARRGLRAALASRWPKRRAAAVGGTTLLAGSLVAYLGRLALYPSFYCDETMYHLALVKTWVAHQAVAPALHLRYPVMVQLDEAIFAAVYGWGGELAVHGVQFMTLLVTAATVFLWGRRWFSARAGLLAAAALLGTPLVVFLGVTGYVDLSVALYTTVGCFAISRWAEDDDRSCLWLGAALVACAASCKYLGLVSVAIAGAWVAAVALPRRRYGAPAEFGLVALVAALPFYGYVYYHTRNPVFPFLGTWFGYSYWTKSQTVSQFTEMTSWGGDKTLTSFLCIFRNLSEMRVRFHTEAPFSGAFFFAWPFAFLAALFHRRARVAFLMVLAYLTFWFLQGQVARYLVPVLPLLCLACAGSVLWILEQVPRSRGVLASWPIALGLSLLALSPTFEWAPAWRGVYGPTPIDDAGRAAFLRRNVPGFSLVERLNRGARRYRVHGVSTVGLAYHFDGEYFGDDFGPYSFESIYQLQNGDDVAAYLASLDVEYLIAERRRILARPFYLSPSFPRRFKLIGEDAEFVLYRLIPTRAAATPPGP